MEAQREALEARLGHGQEEFHNLEDFGAFVSKRANAFRMTTPRFVKVENPKQELQLLLAQLVGPGERSRRAVARAISTELAERFRGAGVAPRLQMDVTVHPPHLPRPFTAPFAYRNGRLNLIEPVEFEGMSASTVFSRASVRAVEGQFLTEYEGSPYGKLGLIVVGKFSGDQDEERKAAAVVFERHGVAMHTFAGLDGLIEEIRRGAH